MALKNRNKGTAGNFRAVVVCPNCGTRCLIEISGAVPKYEMRLDGGGDDGDYSEAVAATTA